MLVEKMCSNSSDVRKAVGTLSFSEITELLRRSRESVAKHCFVSATALEAKSEKPLRPFGNPHLQLELLFFSSTMGTPHKMCPAVGDLRGFRKRIRLGYHSRKSSGVWAQETTKTAP